MMIETKMRDQSKDSSPLLVYCAGPSSYIYMTICSGDVDITAVESRITNVKEKGIILKDEVAQVCQELGIKRSDAWNVRVTKCS